MAQCTHRSLYVLYIHITFISIYVIHGYLPSQGYMDTDGGKGKNHVSNVYATFFDSMVK